MVRLDENRPIQIFITMLFLNESMKILFIGGFRPIVKNRRDSRKLYSETFGINFKEETGEYLHTENLEGCKSFALWPLDQAAQSCFGTDTWPENLAVPNSWLEFDVEDIASATTELVKKGYKLLVQNREEPWGQKVSRFLDPDGNLVALTYSPWLRE